MYKFVLSMILVLASVTGLARAVPPREPGQLPQTIQASDHAAESVYASRPPDVQFGPYDTFRQAKKVEAQVRSNPKYAGSIIGTVKKQGKYWVWVYFR